MARQIGKDDMAPQKCPRDDFCRFERPEDFQSASCASPVQGGALACIPVLAACSCLPQTQQVGSGVLYMIQSVFRSPSPQDACVGVARFRSVWPSLV